MVYRIRRPLRTRKVYRRRKSYRPSARSGLRSKVRDHLAVYHNALSTASTNAKIPDGKCYHSVGLRLQAVKEFQNDGSGTMDFLIFPGINNGVVADSVVSDPLSLNLMPYTNHFSLDTNYEQDAGTEVARWRVVSQACKFTLVNNSDENDGWWEAIRIQVNPQRDDTSPDGWGYGIVDGKAIIGGTSIPGMNLGITNLVEHTTYCTGKLRDIHRHVFDLMPQGSDHDFVETPFKMLESTAVHHMIDARNYDAIFVRIHGRPGASTPTRIMVHNVCNQEVLYQESSTMSRFHSESDNHNAIFQASKRKRQNGDHKAAKKTRTALISAY